MMDSAGSTVQQQSYDLKRPVEDSKSGRSIINVLCRGMTETLLNAALSE